jgi:CHAT domain-containing protein
MRKSLRRRYRQIFIFLVSALFGFITFLNIPIPSVQSAESDPQSISQADRQSLLQQGIDLYKAERFLDAIAIWQQALATFAEADRLNRSLVWSQLCLAYQQLGRWQEAETAIATSLNLLQLDPIQSQPDAAMLAKALNAQGRLYWSRGQVEAALESWKTATIRYEQANDETGMIISSINQATALQTLGFTAQAERTLEQVAERVQQQPDLTLRAIGWRDLGNALRRVGKLKESLKVLQESLKVAEAGEPSIASNTTISAIQLDLGNTERALANKAIAIGAIDQAKQYSQAAIALYQQAAATPSPLLKLQAQLNQFSLLVETEPASAAAMVFTLQPQFTALSPSRSTLYAQLNFVKSLTKLERLTDLKGSPVSDRRSSAQLLATTIQQARQLGDPIAESYGLGQLGELYEQAGQWQAARNLTEQAFLKAEQSPDVRYRWEWQLGRLLEKQADRSGAIAAYSSAVATLKSLRNNLLLSSAEIQFSFRDDVEPIYRGLVKLLLSSEAGTQPSQDSLKQAIIQIDALQLTELENFLGCNLVQTVQLNQTKVDRAAAKIYPMILEDRLAVVLELPGQNSPLAYFEVMQPRQAIEKTLQQLRQDLREPDRTPEALAGLREVDRWLIEPFRSVLTQQEPIESLIFVLDGELRNVPMAALYDGNQYLISRYAIAIAPKLALFQPSRRSQNLDVFLGGIGEPQTVNQETFPKIENLSSELEEIRRLVQAKPPLLNAEFTEINLERSLQGERFSAIHLKTHGVFSSDPEETFIVAYQELITGKDLGRLIQTGRVGEASPIELLVLSACSTAQGDNRAVLGLAGTAVQAGARSVVSTLWEAQDFPNTQLMIQFYRELLNPSTTKAQALRRAQLHLLEQGYSTPHIWATYVLVGNWL